MGATSDLCDTGTVGGTAKYCRWVGVLRDHVRRGSATLVAIRNPVFSLFNADELVMRTFDVVCNCSTSLIDGPINQ